LASIIKSKPLNLLLEVKKMKQLDWKNLEGLKFKQRKQDKIGLLEARFMRLKRKHNDLGPDISRAKATEKS